MDLTPCGVYPVCLRGGGYSCPFSRYSIDTTRPHISLVNGTSTRESCILDSVTVPQSRPDASRKLSLPQAEVYAAQVSMHRRCRELETNNGSWIKRDS